MVAEPGPGEVDHGVDARQRGPIEPSAGGVPSDLTGGRSPAHDRHRHVADLPQTGCQSGADQPARSGDGHAHDPYPARVRTRTLLLLAVACGLAILAAGTIQLLRLANEDTSAELHAVGDAVRVGDLDVTVLSFTDTGGTATAELRVGGVDDPDGVDDFRLVVPGRSLAPTGQGTDDCAGTTVAMAECTVTFDTSAASGDGRVLLYRRGDDVARWQVTAG